MSPAKFASVLLLSALSVAACSDSTEPTETSLTSVLLTDAPFPYDRVARVDVYIVRIMASEKADTGSNVEDSTQTGLRTIVEPNQRYDLLTLQGGRTAPLGDANLPATVYRSVRLTMSTDSSSITLKDGTVLTGASSPGVAWQGEGVISLNAVVHEPVEIADTGAVIVIDFDVGRSFIPVGADTVGGSTGFLFIPYIRAVNSAGTGSISGAVVGADQGGPIPGAAIRVFLGDPAMPENTWALMSSGKADAVGSFQIGYLTPRTYIIRVDAPASSAYGHAVVPAVVVTAGQETSVGTVTLPAR
ncbi:MAG: DUF4382 domain-containing protein [Gemmatimonadales bacterium]|nr:DUF4382 domain-containing protein [Gemmatimonadales bacterium]NIN10880.1 DUF4382 domain-containing protein [Gemmatimonadales bacterium]NIR02888.1 DUF4382 domain-containing protein [Gemmatimonadales bacterium]NIS66522.1 DUF4382 domain-containing protein [Gemmatimonadales bacterium]